jgi:flavin reductase (DIM6/NTAB) family NADH-FMN oxidoreductase RutF
MATTPMIAAPTPELLQAMATVPAAQFLLTTAYGDVRDGRIVERVQQCGTNPPMLLIAMEKGHTLSPLIRDSRTFAVSLLDPAERLLQRVFGPDRRVGDDPFLTYKHTRGVLGAHSSPSRTTRLHRSARTGQNRLGHQRLLRKQSRHCSRAQSPELVLPHR